MTEVDDELLALRTRAYGPDADIHLDPSALQRLRQLEGSDRPREVASVPDAPRAIHLEPEIAPIPTEESDPVWRARIYPALLTIYRRVRRIKRSNFLIGLGVVLVVACLIVAVGVVQRVQTDPLQAGGTQVARLPVDSSYLPPTFFSGSGTSLVGFSEFHGLRPVVGTLGFFALNSDGHSDCLTLYSETAMQNLAGGGYSGFATSGCAAGSFPAIVQFTLDARELPEEARAAFADATGLQFVYDRTNQEVVVFATTPSTP